MIAHRFVAGALLLAAVLCGDVADARSVLLGGRSASMGMATIATGDDGAMPYLNPAGLVNTADDTLSISANLYLHQRLVHRDWFVPGAPRSELGELRHTDADRTSTSFTGMPSSVSYMLHLGERGKRWHQVIALSLLVPDVERRSAVDDFDYLTQGGLVNLGGRSNVTQLLSTELYLAGASYAVELNRYVKLGASAFYAHDRRAASTVAKFIDFFGTGEDFTSTDSSVSVSSVAHGLLFAVGAQLSLPWVRLGAALQPPSIHLDGDYRSSLKETRIALAAGGSTQIVHEESRGEYTVRHPLSARFGAALVLRRWTIEAAMTLVAGDDSAREARGTTRRLRVAQLEPASGTTADLDLRVEQRQVVNAALGLEFAVNDKLTLRAGAYTDLDRAPTLPDALESEDLGLEHIDFIGATLGASYDLAGGTTEIGIGFAHGFGEASTLNAFAEGSQPPVTVDVRAFNLMFILAGTLSVDELKGQLTGGGR